MCASSFERVFARPISCLVLFVCECESVCRCWKVHARAFMQVCLIVVMIVIVYERLFVKVLVIMFAVGVTETASA